MGTKEVGGDTGVFLGCKINEKIIKKKGKYISIMRKYRILYVFKLKIDFTLLSLLETYPLRSNDHNLH